MKENLLLKNLSVSGLEKLFFLSLFFTLTFSVVVTLYDEGFTLMVAVGRKLYISMIVTIFWGLLKVLLEKRVRIVRK